MLCVHSDVAMACQLCYSFVAHMFNYWIHYIKAFHHLFINMYVINSRGNLDSILQALVLEGLFRNNLDSPIVYFAKLVVF
jgi:hypothetical protein